MYRTILVTKLEHIVTREHKEIYGRYDAVKIANDGYKIIGTEKRRYKMSDETFARYGEIADV